MTILGAGAIASWLIDRGLAKTVPGAEKAAGILRWIAIVLVLVLVLGVGKCAYDRNLVDRHDREQAAAADREALAAERRANAAQGKRDADFQAGQAAIKEGMNNAKASDPAGAAKPVGPVQRGYFDSLPNDAGAS